MASPSEQHAVIINGLSASTKVKLQELPAVSTDRCVYRVSYAMRVSNEQHFTPRIVSIGPIHNGNEKLRANEHLKQRYLADFCELTKVSLEECYKHILHHERRLRNCYADFIELNSENFVKMILVDASFILMMLVFNYCRRSIKPTDLVFTKPKMILDIKYDLLLLENQLPFFILDDLYKLSNLQRTIRGMLDETVREEIALTFVVRKFLKDFYCPEVLEQPPPSMPGHILDLYRSCLIPADWYPKRKEAKITNIPNTKKLHQAGMKIQKGCKQNIFDIRFSDGILKIPPLFIYDTTELLYRNLLAYELCHLSKTHFFSDYFQMMRLLTISSEDTELLVQKGVIVNGLSNVERISTLFQNIDIGNVIDWSQFLYGDIIEGLNEYYKNCWHKWKATLKEKYFKAPWAICSVSAAVLLLVLAVVQMVFTILRDVHPI